MRAMGRPVAVVLLMAAGCGRTPEPIKPGTVETGRDALVARSDPLGEAVQQVVFLEQNWTPEEAVEFYFTPQGSQIVPYEWFLALEQPDSRELFRANENLMRYRYLPQQSGPRNPDGLPVGFVADAGTDRRWLGLTCAACHTAEIRWGDVAYRIDGGPTQADTQAFFIDLVLAMKQTRDDPERFERFAERVLGKEAADSEMRSDLQAQLAYQTEVRDGYNQRNFQDYNPTSEARPAASAYGRLDAVDAIVNEVYWHAVPKPEAEKPTVVAHKADALVSFPFLWDTPQHKHVEWLGIAQSGGLGGIFSLSRNTGEVLGVFGSFEVPERAPVLPGYRSSVRFAELKRLEALVVKLWSPQWPAAFPPIDRVKAKQGAVLYATRFNGGESCLDCHALIDRKDPKRRANEHVLDTDTDRRAYDNFFGKPRPSGRLEGRRSSLIGGSPIGPVADANTMLSHTVQQVILGFWREAPHDALTEITFGGGVRALVERPAPRYKARPLNGIWATAPFLHNGSVPNLDALLRPAAERPGSFSIGVKSFDPVKVGFLTDVEGFPRFSVNGPDGSPLTGNSNAGHEYGAHLTEEQRAQLVEYLKTL